MATPALRGSLAKCDRPAVLPYRETSMKTWQRTRFTPRCLSLNFDMSGMMNNCIGQLWPCRVKPSPIYLTPIADAQDQDTENFVLDRSDDPPVAYAILPVCA